MKECLNCKKIVRDTDKYCRNCGIKILTKIETTIINVIKTSLIIVLIITIVMFILSYLI